MQCQLGVIPDPDHRGPSAPAIAWCFTHQCRGGSGGCEKARIAQLEAALRPFALYRIILGGLVLCLFFLGILGS